MEDLLERLKRERRWTIACFLVGAAFIIAVRFAFAPDPIDLSFEPPAESRPAEATP
jgi:hypothetical protein